MSGHSDQQTVQALEQLTLQVSRLAYAVERVVARGGACRRCGCNIVPLTACKCPVCREPYEGKEPDHGNSGVSSE